MPTACEVIFWIPGLSLFTLLPSICQVEFGNKGQLRLLRTQRAMENTKNPETALNGINGVLNSPGFVDPIHCPARTLRASASLSPSLAGNGSTAPQGTEAPNGHP